MEKKYVLSIDSGGTGIRAILFNKAVEIVERAYEKTLPMTPEPGALEHDPIVLWEGLKKVVNEVLSKPGFSAEDVAAIGITNQRGSFLLWDKKTGEPVCNLISWADQRCADRIHKMNKNPVFQAVQFVARVASFLLRSVMLKTTGMITLNPSFAITRLKWLLDTRPELRKRADNGELLFGTLDTWFIYKLTGGKEHLTDVSNAAGTSMYNHFQFKWNTGLCNLFKVPTNMFPEVKENVDDFGMTEKSLWGVEIPIKAAIGDQMAALFGHCSFNEGDVKISQGSGSFVDINVGPIPKMSKHGLFPIIAWKINNEPIYLLEGQINTAGTLIDWLGQGIGVCDTPVALNELAAETEETQGVIFIPTPSGVNFPYFNPKMRASIFGLSLATHRRHVARAVLEGIALRNVEILKGIERDAKVKINSIRVDGGVSKSDLLLQILADLSGVKVERAPESDMTATGAAYMAGIGAGFWKGIEDLKKIRKKYDQFNPKMDPAIAKEKLKMWQKAVKAALSIDK